MDVEEDTLSKIADHSLSCNLSEICRKDHSETEHQDTAGSQAWAQERKVERSQRKEESIKSKSS